MLVPRIDHFYMYIEIFISFCYNYEKMKIIYLKSYIFKFNNIVREAVVKNESAQRSCTKGIEM